MHAKELTTHQAFAKLIQLRGIHHELGISSSTVRTWRKKVNDHPDDPTQWSITLDRIEALLTLTGHQVIQEKLWKK
jgi:hypothetical protein